MATDSDKLTASYRPLLDKAKAEASRRSGEFDAPPERPEVVAARSANDARGRRIDPLRRGK